ncbi:MAG: hypothetical protein KatS3mg123_1305 [Burkholderiales bacterium]|nr:MAG: hypothetical protein KatS3mg123_1305 [Burkholderiales bacterium]
MNRESLIFLQPSPWPRCSGSLVCAVGFRYAAHAAGSRGPGPGPRSRRSGCRNWILGSFGRVSGIDLVAYWMEHPPAGQGAEAMPRRPR